MKIPLTKGELMQVKTDLEEFADNNLWFEDLSEKTKEWLRENIDKSNFPSELLFIFRKQYKMELTNIKL